MIINRMAGGAGGAYNFTATAYGTVGSLPASPADNALGLITSTPIPALDSGGIMFRSTAPTTRANGTALESGDVYFVTSSLSGYPFYGIAGIMIYIITAYQYNGSTWVEIEVYIGVSSAWQNIVTLLYYNGIEFTALTGGWQSRAQMINGSQVQSPTLTKNASYMSASLYNAGPRSGVTEVVNDIDLTDVSTLSFDMSVDSHGQGEYIIATGRGAGDYYTGASAVETLGGVFTRQIKTLDVSALSGFYNVCVGQRVYGHTSLVLIYGIELS